MGSGNSLLWWVPHESFGSALTLWGAACPRITWGTQGTLALDTQLLINKIGERLGHHSEQQKGVTWAEQVQPQPPVKTLCAHHSLKQRAAS